MLKKAINKIRDYLPVSRRELKKVVKNILIVVDALEASDNQHAQIEKGLIESIEKSRKIIKGMGGKTQTDDVAFG